MSREINGRIVMRVSDDGTRCAAECPYYRVDDACGDECDEFRGPMGGASLVWNREHGEYDRHPACIAAEQAAASVSSCERDVDMKVRGMRDAVEIMRNIAPQALAALPQIEAAIEAIWRGPAPASEEHLDGGARALDASEALREARVQGMREALRILGVPSFGKQAHQVEAAIEAVRKGER